MLGEEKIQWMGMAVPLPIKKITRYRKVSGIFCLYKKYIKFRAYAHVKLLCVCVLKYIWIFPNINS